MTEQENVGAVDTAPAQSPADRLESYFNGTAEQQIDNSDAATDETVEESAPDEVEDVEGEVKSDPDEKPEKEDKPEKEKTPQDEPKDATDDTKESEAEETANFDALEKAPEFLDADAIKAKIPRQSHKMYELATQYSEAAKRGYEAIEKLGGESYIEPLAKVSEGLRPDGNIQALFEGVAQAEGQEGILRVLEGAFELALVVAPELKKDPSTAGLSDALMAAGEKVYQQRFGLSAEQLEKASELVEQGWLEKIAKWQEDEWFDAEEAQELLDAANDPKLKAQRAETARLQAQLAERTKQAEADETLRGQQQANEFITSVTGEIDTALTKHVFPSSVLRDLASDTPEQKAEKAFLRQTIQQQAVDAFARSDMRARLLDQYRKGQSGTASFKADMVKSVGQAILATKDAAKTAEKLIARAYGSTRNAKLIRKDDSEKGLTPTVPPQDKGDRPSPQEKSSKDLDKKLEDALFDQLAQQGLV